MNNGIFSVVPIRPREGGFESAPPPMTCRHPSHEPPSNLYVPPGTRYRHVCPGCGVVILIHPTVVTL